MATGRPVGRTSPVYSSIMRPLRSVLLLPLPVLLVVGSPGAQAQAQAPAPSGPLVVYNAGSLARPLAEMLRAFARRHPGVQPQQENSGSVEAARKLTELGKIPDVLAVADYRVISELLVPAHTRWYASFARNAMVLAYTRESVGADRITPANWFDVIRRPGVRTGRSDPALDPNGYRTLMVLQLAEGHYRRPGLAKALLDALPAKYMRPKEADLTALLQSGELDYVWSYASIATTLKLPFVRLPAEIDLSDPARAAAYAAARVTLPPARSGGPPLVFTGEPIVYALTIPAKAPHPATAAAFVRFALGAEGRRILAANGFTLLDRPQVTGAAPAGVLP
jgi:molybdate/tungstate transport system substrate-binding protein